MRRLLCLISALAGTSGAHAEGNTNPQTELSAPTIFRSPADGGARRCVVTGEGNLTLLDSPSYDALPGRQVIAGAILTNLGCTHIDHRLWCEVRAMSGGSIGFVLTDRLSPALGPDGTIPTGTDDSARRIRVGDFDVRGTVPCAQEHGQALGECTVRVAQSGGGDATAQAKFTNGFSRTLYFVNGKFVAANPTMSGVGTDTDWRIADDTYFIRVDDQRYELPQDLILGN